MSKWQGFLDSLATKGGNILLLVMLSIVFLVAALVLMLKFGAVAPSVVLVVGSFNGFAGALLMALVGKDRNGNGSNGNGGAPIAPGQPAH